MNGSHLICTNANSTVTTPALCLRGFVRSWAIPPDDYVWEMRLVFEKFIRLMTSQEMGNLMGAMMPEMVAAMPGMMPKVMPAMIERVGEMIPMPEYMQKQMPDLMPKVMAHMMPKVLPAVVPYVLPAMRAYLMHGRFSKN